MGIRPLLLAIPADLGQVSGDSPLLLALPTEELPLPADLSSPVTMSGTVIMQLGSPSYPLYRLIAPSTPWNQAPLYMGSSVALFSDTDGGGAGLAVGISRGDTGTISGTGEVRIYRYDPAADPTWPFRLTSMVVGESYRPESQLGGSVAIGEQAGIQMLFVGAPQGTAFGQNQKIDNGTVYVSSLAP